MPTVECGGCGAKYRVSDAQAGKRLKCPKCGAAVDVPQAADSGEFEPSMLDLALLKELPKPKAPEGPKLSGEEAAFANLVSSVESGEAVRTAAPVAAAPAARLTRKQRKAVKAAARERAGSHADMGPSVRADVQERHAKSDWVGLLFSAALIGWIIMATVLLAIDYDNYADGIEAANAKYGKGNYEAREFNFGRKLLVFSAIPVLFCMTVVPAIALGTWINNKIFNIRMHGSVFGTAIAECAIPVVCAAVGMGIGALVGSGDGGVKASAMMGLGIGIGIGGIIVIPAYWIICGYRFLEGLCGQAITRATGGVGGVAFGLALAMIFAMMAAADHAAEKEQIRKAELAKIAQQRQEREAREAQRRARIEQLNASARPSNASTGSQSTAPPRPAEPAGPTLTPFEQMLADLGSDSPTRRYAALLQAKAAKPMDEDLPRVEAALLGVLGSPKSTREHIAALEAAIHWNLIDTDAKLLDALRSDDILLWTFAGKELAARKNRDALDILLGKLQHSDAAAEMLRSYGDAATSHALIAFEIAQSDAERARLLGLVEPALTRKTFEPMKPYATAEFTPLAQRVRAIWHRLDPQTFEPLETALADLATNDPARQELGIESLGKVKPDPSFSLRVSAALIDYVKARPAGLSVDSPVPELFGKWHDRQTVEELKTWLDDEADPEGQRRSAMLLLSTWREPGTLRMVQAWLLRDPDTAVEALRRYGEEAEAPMLRLINDENETIAVSAIRVLEAVGTERALPRLRSAMNSRRLRVAAAAESAYTTIDTRVLNQR